MADASQATLQRTLHKIAKLRHYADYKLEVKPVSSGGANYTSRLFRGKIVTNSDILEFFSKVAVIAEEMRSQMPVHIYFVEQYAYNKIAQIYENIQNKHGVPKDQRLAMPIMYGYDETVNKEVIVLQDLEAKGFTTHDRLRSFDWQYASAAVQQLARLHALSIALQHDYPEDYDEVKKTVQFTQMDSEDFITGLMQQTVTRTLATIKEENKERFSVFFEELIPKINELYFEQPPRPILIHGDFRMSNIMHKIHKDGEIELIIIDYQTLDMSSVARDLMYFIFTGSDKAFRRQHYRQLLDYYYQQLSLTLTTLHLDPDQDFPKDDYENDLKKNLALGLVMAAFALPVVTVAEECAPELDDSLSIESILQVEVSDVGRERLNDVVDDFIEWGVL